MSDQGWSPLKLLQELLSTYGPSGQEDAVRDVCRRELEPLVDESWVDEAGNLVGLVRGSDDGSATRVMAHMDELSMLVKRVDPDGTLYLTPLGTMYPANFGLGPVAVLGDSGDAVRSADAGLGTHDQGEPADLGDQARPGRQSP